MAAKETLPLAETTLPSRSSTSSSFACSKWAPMSLDRLGSWRQAVATAPAAGHRAARSVGAGARRCDRGVAITHGDLVGVDRRNLGGNLREHRLVALALRMHAGVDNELAIAGHARCCRLQSGHQLDAPPGISERPGSVGRLLIEGREAETDAAVRPARRDAAAPRTAATSIISTALRMAAG